MVGFSLNSHWNLGFLNINHNWGKKNKHNKSNFKKNVLLVNSGQHKNFLNFYSKENKTRFDIQVNNLQSTKSLTKNIKKSIEIFYQLIRKNNPEIVIVQGDTTSSAAFAYAAKLNGVTVIHNEAGLRTFDKKNPYPEELNRKLISSVADIHFAPTKLNKKNLIKEGITKENIFIVLLGDISQIVI